MLRRSRAGRIVCRIDGEHTVVSTRLRVTTARWSDYVASRLLTRDAEARHWLGWGPEDVSRDPPRVEGADPLVISPGFVCFAGIEPRTRRVLVSVSLTRCLDGAYEVGGMVDPECRGQGYGHEALDAVCRLTHEHFGIGRLRAGCEATNVASQRWLASCQFVRVDGPVDHVLPDGRVIQSLWWQRIDGSARRRCPYPIMG